MDQETYELLIAMVGGTFRVPLNERTKKQKAALRRFYRYQNQISVINGELFFKGQPVAIAEQTPPWM